MPEASSQFPKMVSVVMPTYMEEGYIERVLDSLRQQKFDGAALEILVADGMSTDRTREIVQRIAASDPRVRLIDNPGRTQARGLNAGIKASRGDMIVRADAHAEYAPDYLARCVEVMRATNADNVGGAQRPKWETPFQDCVARAFGSFLGSGGAKWRDQVYEGPVDHVWLGAFKREVFSRIGLYDPDASPNEDAEIDIRINKAGGTVYLSPKIVAYYFPRKTLGGVWRQYYHYGRLRFRTLMLEGTLVIRPLVPFLFFTGVAVLAGLSFVTPYALWALGGALGLYSLAILEESLRHSRGGRWWYPFALAAILPTMQLGHATGFWAGLLTPKNWRSRSAPIEKL